MIFLKSSARLRANCDNFIVAHCAQYILSYSAPMSVLNRTPELDGTYTINEGESLILLRIKNKKRDKLNKLLPQIIYCSMWTWPNCTVLDFGKILGKQISLTSLRSPRQKKIKRTSSETVWEDTIKVRNFCSKKLWIVQSVLKSWRKAQQKFEIFTKMANSKLE